MRTLTALELDILRHVARYRLSTPPIIHRLCAEPAGVPISSTYAALSRLQNHRHRAYLASAKLYGSGRQIYLHLTPDGAEHLGLPAEIGHGFHDLHAKAHHLGRLLFCCGRHHRPKFSLQEFDELFPGYLEPSSALRKRFLSDAYFLDDTHGVRRLGRVLVDTAANTMKSVQRALTVAAETLPEFVHDGRFALAVVFPTEGKRRHFRYQLSNAAPSIDVHVLLDVQPALLPLVVTAMDHGAE